MLRPTGKMRNWRPWLVGLGRGWSDERDVVFLHRIVERRDVFRKHLAPLRKLRFELHVEFSVNSEFPCSGLRIGAIDRVLQVPEFAVQFRRVIQFVLAGLRIYLDEFFLDRADLLA